MSVDILKMLLFNYCWLVEFHFIKISHLIRSEISHTEKIQPKWFSDFDSCIQRFEKGITAFKDTNIYMLEKFLNYIKSTDTCLVHCRHANIYWMSKSTNLPKSFEDIFIFNLYNFLGYFIRPKTISCTLLDVPSGLIYLIWQYFWGYNHIFSTLSSL